MFQQGSTVWASWFCLVIVSLSAAIVEGGNDRTARGVIFAEQHVLESALDIHRRLIGRPATERYEIAAAWVLPGADHQTFRLPITFSTTNPPPYQLLSTTNSVGAANGRRVPSGGELVSPAIDLIDAATELGRLDEIRERVEAAKPNSDRQQRARLALLTLIDLKAGDVDRALIHSDELFSRVLDEPLADFSGRWPETLVVHRCLDEPQAHAAAEQPLYTMLQQQVRNETSQGPAAWDRWVTAAFGRLESSQQEAPSAVAISGWDHTTDSQVRQRNLANWQPVSRTTGWSRGQGMPTAVWQLSPGLAHNFASHDDDYLYYAVPLRGNIDVECDVTALGWRDSHLFFAGTYVSHVFDHVTYRWGTFHQAFPMGQIEPRLSPCDEWIRYRLSVRDGRSTTYLNGRQVHVQLLPDDHDPWLAIRSPWFTDGAVRNLAVRGQPEVPESINLLTDDGLSCWSAYHGEPIVGRQRYWQLLERDGRRELVGKAEPEFASQAVERLLQYHRPMLEDGTISYEFFYRDGETCVHPALDRKVFVMRPEGVGIHWQTDGVFERMNASPREVVDEPGSQVRPTRTVLLDNQWNQMEVSVDADRVRLSLNGEPVYAAPIEPTNLRTFGLFHWGDESDVRVRNIRWRGQWPNELPPIIEQSLADPATAELDERTAQLLSVFEHDFAAKGLPDNRFRSEGKHTVLTEVSGEGIRLGIESEDAYGAGWISPLVQVQGDFDIEAEFAVLTTSGGEDSSCGIALQVVTEDPQTTHSSVYRGRLRKPGTPDRSVMQSEFNRLRSDGGWSADWPASTAEESTEGTLRLIRLGDQLHCLFAEFDSRHFRHIHTRTIPTDHTFFGGVRLKVACSSPDLRPATTNVVWKRLSIRADKLAGLP